jgi:DNA polymerase-1
MERHGVLIDPVKLEIQSKELDKRLLELQHETFALADVEFNISSPKQLQDILFNKLKLPILQKTPTGQPSTADSVLQELALDFAMPKLLIEYRSLSKLMTTYTNRLVTQINPETQRIHTSYNQTGAATGRLSSSEPNLQNIPIRNPEGRKIRQAFIAKKGCSLISADYSQIELRIMAHISEDPALMNAFANNLDIHIATAAEVAGVSIAEVTPEMRRNAKAINFGLIYGMSAFGLTRQLGIDRKTAQEYIERYFARYPHVKAYMDNTRTMAKEKGFVETLWGRRLYLPDINASQIPRQKAAERTAINAPLQGSAADIIKMAMIRIDRWLSEENIKAKMIMQVHDELVFEAEQSDLQPISEGIRKHMSEIVSLRVPLLVSIGIGNNWDEASAH